MAKSLLNAVDRDTLYLGLCLIWMTLLVAGLFRLRAARVTGRLAAQLAAAVRWCRSITTARLA